MTQSYATECWLPVVGFEGYYEVSSFGQVRSLERTLQLTNHPRLKERTFKARILFQKSNRPAGGEKGYVRMQVALWKENKEYTRNVARLVAEAFIPNHHSAPFVLHLDDDATNNRVGNLQWGDHAENVRQAVERGRYPSGELHWTCAGKKPR
jgi:hypothetical protein